MDTVERLILEKIKNLPFLEARLEVSEMIDVEGDFTQVEVYI